MAAGALKNIGQRQREANLTQKQKSRTMDQVRNSDGAAVFAVDDRKRLDRFLVLGTEGGSYYASEKNLTKENVKAIKRLIETDGEWLVSRVVEVSQDGRAPKNDYALFALAAASTLGSIETRRAAYKALPLVARIGTHLFHFIAYREQFAGWSRGLRKAVADWYESKSIEDAAFQMAKYQSRDGWSHRDLLRLAHVKPSSPERGNLYRWAVKGAIEQGPIPPIIMAMEEIKTANEKRVIDLVNTYRLGIEFIPTERRTRKVWGAMVDTMGLTALMRNLNQLTAQGVLSQGNMAETGKVCDRLTDAGQIHKARIHPVAALIAMHTYAQGHGTKGKLSWTPVRKVIDALEEMFYLSFKTIAPTGKRHMLALDVSGSMTCGGVAGSSLTPREASAAMAMVTARSESNYMTMAFSGGFVPLDITPRMGLADVIAATGGLGFDRTDCSLPMVWAMKNKVEVDAFVVYTDSETNSYASPQPVVALRRYREAMGIPAKLVVVGMVSNGFSIADPNDGGMLDIVGFDASAPAIMSDFIAE